MGFTRPDNNKSIWRNRPDILQEQSSTVKADWDRLLNENADDLIALEQELEATGANSGADSIGAPAGTVGGHIRSKNNPHEVTAAQLGAATTAALAATGSSPGADLVGGPSGTVGDHLRSQSNPHGTTAAQLGAPTKAELAVTGSTPGANLIGGAAGTVGDHLRNTSNPHATTAAQLSAYTSAQTDAAIEARIVAIGAGDMRQSTYDTAKRETDVFIYADAAVTALQGDIDTALSAVDEDIDDLDARVTTAQADATAAGAAAGVAQTTATIAQTTANAAMPKAGGYNFTGNVAAYSTNRTGACLRNIKTENSAGTDVSTNMIIFRRK